MCSPSENYKWQRKIYKSAIALVTIGSIFLTTHPSRSIEELVQNSLPLPPDTGSPEEDFSAGGTRDSHQVQQICGEKSQEIVYLLGNKNRELTLSVHPTFWFYIPEQFNPPAQINFVLTEVETGKKIYDRLVQLPKQASMLGISIPAKSEYALSPQVNYRWSLEINCTELEQEPIIALEGWLYRSPINADLQNQLTAISEEQKYTVYLDHNFLYDALNNLVQMIISQPQNHNLNIAWNQLLVELGWQDLAEQSTVKAYILDTSLTKFQVTRGFPQ
ncbi:MAG: DUF928 domain-containing protein [Xenococcaceae cyanobacterium]